MRKRLFVILIGLLVLIQGCAPAALPTPTATPTIDPATPAAATSAVETKAAEEALAAANAQATADALSTVSAQETADAIVFGTQTAAAQATAAELSLHKTSTAAVKQTQSAFAAATTTARANYVTGLIDKLVSENYLTTNAGQSYELDDFDLSVAKINYYTWDPVPYTAENFVVDTDMAWESASESAQWFTSGCGFVFRAEMDSNKHYFVYLGLDGYVYVLSNINGRISMVTSGYYGQLERMEGGAHFTMAVEDRLITVIVNDKEVISDSAAVLKGNGLAYTMVSGINSGFGTHCVMTNTVLWKMKK